MYEFATDLLNTTNPPLVVSMSWGWPEPMQCQVRREIEIKREREKGREGKKRGKRGG
jgi:hypothetical protein